MRVLGINAVLHDPASALVVDGEITAAAEEERFTRRKHGKAPVPFSTWEVPRQSAAWCLEEAGLAPEDLDAVAYSYDPSVAPAPTDDITTNEWEGLRTLYAQRSPMFLASALPGLDPQCVRFVPHHVAHAASAYLAASYDSSSVMVLDGRGERSSYLAGRCVGGALEVLATQELPHSVGLFYEEATAHLGFKRSSDEYKVMALAAVRGHRGSAPCNRVWDPFRRPIRPHLSHDLGSAAGAGEASRPLEGPYGRPARAGARFRFAWDRGGGGDRRAGAPSVVVFADPRAGTDCACGE